MDHAYLSPSGAELDLKCPGNRREQAKYPSQSSDPSAKGTGMHALGAKCLERGHHTKQYIGWWCGEIGRADFLLKNKPAPCEGLRAFQITKADADGVQIYVDRIVGLLKCVKNSTLHIEQKVEINENTWGTADCQIRQPFGSLYIDDYKNGFTFVDANTPQLKLYAIGSMGVDNPNCYNQIVCTITQPNAMSAEPIRSVAYTPRELISWFKGVYMPAAEKCMEPDAELIPGDWCKDKWCDARHNCPALHALREEVVGSMFEILPGGHAEAVPVAEMSPEVRNRILDNRELIIDQLNEIYKYEYARAQHGKNSWGKLVQGKRTRYWASEEVTKASVDKLIGNDKYDWSIKSPAQMEYTLKQVGGLKTKDAKALVSGLVFYKESSPKLVPLDAPGEAVNPVNKMFEEV